MPNFLLSPGGPCARLRVAAPLLGLMMAGAFGSAGGEGPAAEAALTIEAFELTEGNLPRWREHLLPTPEELRWQEIGWLPTFSDGLLQADARQKPLLLWVMNGHPLGCT